MNILKKLFKARHDADQQAKRQALVDILNKNKEDIQCIMVGPEAGGTRVIVIGKPKPIGRVIDAEQIRLSQMARD